MIRTGIASPRAIHSLQLSGIIPPGVLIDPLRDTIFVSHRDQFPLAVLTARPVWWVHGLDLNPSAPPRLSRLSLQPLIDFARGFTLDRPLPLTGAILQLSPTSGKLESLIRQLEAVDEGNSPTFRLDF